MESRLTKRFVGLEHDRARLLVHLGQWTPELLRFRASPQTWSALQVLDHICRVEESILGAMRSSKGDRSISPRDRVSSSVLYLLFLLPSRVKVPGTVTQIMPGDTLELDALSKSWNGIRETMKAWLEQLGPADCRGGRFRHPVGGWLSVTGALSFLSVHLRHHRYQLDRIRRAAGPNPPAASRIEQ